MGALSRGFRNPFRNRVLTAIVVILLAMVIGLFAVLVQGALATRQQSESLQANVRTVIEPREAGAFGTGGFGGRLGNAMADRDLAAAQAAAAGLSGSLIIHDRPGWL